MVTEGVSRWEKVNRYSSEYVRLKEEVNFCGELHIFSYLRGLCDLDD